MTTHTIEIEGLPEGWEAKPIKLPNMLMGSGGELYADVVITLQKTKPRRIVLEETEEDNVMDGRYWKDQGFAQGKVLVVSQPKIWRIKEE